METIWRVLPFSQLSPVQLYDWLKLRGKVFAVEQQCIFLDMDDRDQTSAHVLGYEDEKLMAGSRLIPAGVAHEAACIGRVVIDPSFRKRGLGRKLMDISISELYARFGQQPIHISAQQYLKAFYESYGFRQEGESYLEDGIPHISMLLK